MNDDMLAAWDRLRAAIDGVECALPIQMSKAISTLIAERTAFRDLVHKQNRAARDRERATETKEKTE